jgi:hypothetical protein
MLKLRWQALKCLPARLGTRKNDHLIIWEVIKAAMVLHNLYIATAPPYEPTDEEMAAEAIDRAEQEAMASVTESTEPHGVENGDYERREQINWLTALADKRVTALDMRTMFPDRPVGLDG